MVKRLPVFDGYTIDVRLKQFRRVSSHNGIEFVDFDSPKGDLLLERFVKTIDASTDAGRKLLISLWD